MRMTAEIHTEHLKPSKYGDAARQVLLALVERLDVPRDLLHDGLALEGLLLDARRLTEQLLQERRVRIQHTWWSCCKIQGAYGKGEADTHNDELMDCLDPVRRLVLGQQRGEPANLVARLAELRPKPRLDESGLREGLLWGDG